MGAEVTHRLRVLVGKEEEIEVYAVTESEAIQRAMREPRVITVFEVLPALSSNIADQRDSDG